MQIRKATTQDLECVRELTRETICQIYPKYYPAGAVQFFLNHHCDGKISADIRQGCVYLAEDPADGIVGTVTVKADEISRLFVLPEQQRKGYGQALLARPRQCPSCRGNRRKPDTAPPYSRSLRHTRRRRWTHHCRQRQCI